MTFTQLTQYGLWPSNAAPEFAQHGGEIGTNTLMGISNVNGSGTISGAGNALRVTLGGTSTNPGGTIAALQLDSDFASGGTWTNSSYIRCTNSGTGTIDTFAVLPNAMVATQSAAAVSHVIAIKNASGTPYYLMVSNAA